MINCKFENGNPAKLRHVTVDAIVIKNKKILLVKRSTKVIEGGKYCLPGGYLERDETATQGVLREVKEETGYKGKIKTLLKINTNPNRKGEDRQNVDFVFIVEVSKKITNTDWEVIDTKWFDIDSIPNKKEFAFDHFDSIHLYKKYLVEKFNLPKINEL